MFSDNSFKNIYPSENIVPRRGFSSNVVFYGGVGRI